MTPGPSGSLADDYVNRFHQLLDEANVRAPAAIRIWLKILLDHDTPWIKRRYRTLDVFIEQMIVKYPAYSPRAINNLVRRQRQMSLRSEDLVRRRIRAVHAKLRMRRVRALEKTARETGDVAAIVQVGR